MAEISLSNLLNMATQVAQEFIGFIHPLIMEKAAKNVKCYYEQKCPSKKSQWDRKVKRCSQNAKQGNVRASKIESALRNYLKLLNHMKFNSFLNVLKSALSICGLVILELTICKTADNEGR